jgi:hypothetical protein
MACGTAAGLWAGEPLPARLQAPSLSTRPDLCLVHATVVDSRGAPVPGLTSKDFIVEDNGVVVDVPIVADDSSPLGVGVVLNRDAFARVIPGLHDILGALGPNDVAGVANLNQTEMTLTRDAGVVIRGLAIGWPARSAWDGVAVAVNSLARWPYRRAIVFVAGEEISPSDPMERYEPSRDPRREPQPGVSTSDVTRSLEKHAILLHVIRFDSAWRDEFVDRLARDTGGRTFKIGSQVPLEARINQIVDGLRQRSYVLGFVPSKLDGKTHKLAIRSVRRGVTVTARTEYRATP